MEKAGLLKTQLICFRSLTKKKKLEEHKKRIAETESMIATKSDLLKEVESLLSSLGSDGPPKGLDLPDITGDNLVGFLCLLQYYAIYCDFYS